LITLDCLLPFSNFWKFFVHILCMASVDYCDGVAIYRVGEVPLELCSSLLTLDNAQIRFGIVLAQSQPCRY